MKSLRTILAAVALLSITPITSADLFVPLVDGPDDSGWRAVLPDDTNVGIVVDRVTCSYVRIEIAKNFNGPPENGDFPRIIILFEQTGDDANTVGTIQITDELITNNTGSKWTDYHWQINGPAAFDKTATEDSGFSINPFTNKSWTAKSGWGSDYALALDVDGGEVPNGGTFAPGISAGKLYIDVALDENDSDFCFVQYPTPEPGTMVLLALGGAGMLCRRRNRHPRTRRKVMNRKNRTNASHVVAAIVGIQLVLAASGPAMAAPAIDGRYDQDEGYALGRFVDLTVEGIGATVEGGELWTCVDPVTGDVSVLFSQPLTLVDNTYGDNLIGWGRNVAPSGKNHNFKDLKGSDKAQFTFTDTVGNVVLDVTMDYISETSKGSGVHACLGVTGGDGKVHTGSAGDVLEWGSSLDYNFNALGYVLTQDSPATDENYTENPGYPGWEFAVVYELRVAGGLFQTNGFGDVSIPIVHDSPNKIDRNKVFPEINSVIPEPATIALLALGGVGVLTRRRR